MTEAEWLETHNPGKLLSPRLPIDPDGMLKYAAGQYIAARKRAAGDRKLRLFACACCRRHWSLLSDAGQAVVLQTEEFAEGRLARKELHALRRSANIPQTGFDVYHPDHLARNAIEPHALASAYLTGNVSRDLSRRTPDDLTNLFDSATLIREVFGNPFRPVAINPTWLTSTVLGLADGIYQDRSFDRMPILADALQDAGCDNDDILSHCRLSNEHVRGCWVVDLILGKT